MSLASHPDITKLLPPILPGQVVSVGIVKGRPGNKHEFDFMHYLHIAKSDPEIRREFERAWFIGAILRLGDVLAQCNYFTRAPELELIRYIRNGVAHGNRFRIRNPESLTKYPAHNRHALVKNGANSIFDITVNLNGQTVLFDFMEAGDILDLFSSVGQYLTKIGLENDSDFKMGTI